MHTKVYAAVGGMLAILPIVSALEAILDVYVFCHRHTKGQSLNFQLRRDQGDGFELASREVELETRDILFDDDVLFGRDLTFDDTLEARATVYEDLGLSTRDIDLVEEALYGRNSGEAMQEPMRRMETDEELQARLFFLAPIIAAAAKVAVAAKAAVAAKIAIAAKVAAKVGAKFGIKAAAKFGAKAGAKHAVKHAAKHGIKKGAKHVVKRQARKGIARQGRSWARNKVQQKWNNRRRKRSLEPSYDALFERKFEYDIENLD
ncbi:hypothetical protein FA15DRAFT_656215 [Coprinopsis marcescibilis]|uniref:Uncharacterized protein n=1 Tax=Coprinopsis marcescibilis TaxID=230819 RepID=A0A5C3KV14_COPMA|nr:hypothetical protein FA15DRAFT_656215 [Coprinopsis marcescibilis]